MRFIYIDGSYINIDHIVSIEKINGNFNTVLRLSNGKNIYTDAKVYEVVNEIEMTERNGKEVSR